MIIENLPFLLTDTVGFIRKLPTDLVDSFKSTLDEVREADPVSYTHLDVYKRQLYLFDIQIHKEIFQNP